MWIAVIGSSGNRAILQSSALSPGGGRAGEAGTSGLHRAELWGKRRRCFASAPCTLRRELRIGRVHASVLLYLFSIDVTCFTCLLVLFLSACIYFHDTAAGRLADTMVVPIHTVYICS